MPKPGFASIWASYKVTSGAVCLMNNTGTIVKNDDFRSFFSRTEWDMNLGDLVERGAGAWPPHTHTYATWVKNNFFPKKRFLLSIVGGGKPVSHKLVHIYTQTHKKGQTESWQCKWNLLKQVLWYRVADPSSVGQHKRRLNVGNDAARCHAIDQLFAEYLTKRYRQRNDQLGIPFEWFR